jgi:hypothetical protein
MEKRTCFGTTEFSETSAICGGCDEYVECKDIKPKKLPERKIRYFKKLGDDIDEVGIISINDKETERRI